MQPPFSDLQPPLRDRTRVDGLLTATAALLTTDPERALELSSEALHLALELPYAQGEAQARLRIGQALHRLAEFDSAEAELKIAVERYRELSDQAGEASALMTQGKVSRELGHLSQAADAFEQVLQISDQLGDLSLMADVLNHQAALLHASGQSSQALHCLNKALDFRSQLKDNIGSAQCLNNIGQINLSQLRHSEALEALLKSYNLLKLTNEPTTTARCLMNLAHVYEDISDYNQAYNYYMSALDIGRSIGDRMVELYCLNNLGEVASSQKRHDDARELFSQSLQLSKEVGLRYLTGCAHHGLGQAAAALGRPTDALRHHQQALAIAAELGEQQSEVDALLGLGEAHLRLQATAQAIERLEQALALAEQGDQKKAVAQAHALLADAYEAAGELTRTVQHLRAHQTLSQVLVTEERERSTRQLTVQFDVERAHHEAELYRLRTEATQQAYEEAEARVAQRTQKLARAQVEVVTRLANAAEFRDDVTGEHTLRVGHVSALLARQLGLPAEEVSLLRLAARLHDVGKIGISDLILLKPDKLTQDEFGRMKSHTLIGGQILSGGDSQLLQMAEAIALGHHEHWAGGGYPSGQAGTDTPLVARIVAVADVYDALSHLRPYKRAWTLPEVLAELKRESGRQFQPEIVEALLALHESGELPIQALPREDQEVLGVLVRSSEQEVRRQGQPTSPALAPDALSGQLRDLEARYQQVAGQLQALQVAAFSDPLTGLANRRAFEDELETELLHAVRHSSALSVVSLDIDGLKAINDAEGHERGDALLRTTAQMLESALRSYGRLYRIGGDEFALIAKQVGPAQFEQVCQSVRAAVAEVQASGFPLAELSAGMATFPGEASTQGDLLRLSDQRMYQNKLEHRRHPQSSELHWAIERRDH